jgi:NADPH:quinone reductase-like Zn-dependent oxidoreductase
VLIHGAAGGVGSFAVQLAKWKGAYGIGTASTRNQAFLRQLGVDEPIDYEKTRFEDLVHDVDVVFDPIGGDTQKRSWETLEGRDSRFDCRHIPRKKRLKSMVCTQRSYLLREVHRYSVNLQRSSIRGKSSRWFRRCCRCPKRDRLTSSMRRDMHVARSS